MPNIILMGPPGVGKSTQANEISKLFHIPHISTGDIIRYEMANNSDLGEQLKQSGKNIPDNLMIQIVVDRLSQNDCRIGFILDGFPRTLPQAQALSRLLVTNKIHLDAVIALTADNSILVSRILDRGKTSNRADDNSVDIKDRLDRFTNRTSPVLDYYRRQGILTELNGALPKAQLTQKILRILKH